MKYRSLHHHTTYSYLDGFGLPEAHVRRATEIEMPALACTDHGNISGHVKLEKAAKAAGVKPLFGCELYTGYVDPDRRTQKKNHLTVIAEDQAGYRNLLSMVSRSWEDFYYEPTTGPENLRDHASGLVVLSGCQGSLLATSLIGGKNIPADEASYDRGLSVARRFKRTFGDAYYLEVQAFPELENACRINQFLESIGRKLHIPLVATRDVHYTRPSESEIQKVLHSTRGFNRQTIEELERRWNWDVKLCPPTTDKLMYKRLRGTGLSHRATLESIHSTEEIAERCTVELPKMEQIRFPVPAGTTSHGLWLAWLKEGWVLRGIDSKPNRREYVARLKHEMRIIEGKDFIDYFLFVSDAVKFAKRQGIPVGPARGSAAASLVCYLLQITEVDPIFFSNLVFERFIDVTRQDLPDIDLDFDDDRRKEVKAYLIQKYGMDRVSNIGTFITYKSKIALDDVARAHHIPLAALEPIKSVLLERSSGDLRASATIEDTVEQFEQARTVFERYPELKTAYKLEGQVRGMGVHAAGYVVSNEPIKKVAAIYTRTDDKGNVKLDEQGEQMTVISMDKYDAEEMGILKMDFLGLSNMGLIRIALELVGMTLDDLYDLPLDDYETIKGFQDNDVVGIFQFNGRAMRSVNEDVRPSTFLEICDVGALARPGPLHSGASSEYAEVKRGKEIRSLHPLLDNIVTYTNGQIIYQEQILRIVMEIGGFDWTHAAYIRKIISRKIGEQEFNRQWERFKEGAVERGVPEDVAKEIWGYCITAGSYAFNNAHTVSYGMLGYWTMWFKKHHPLAFYVAALIKLKNETQDLLRDAINHGIEIRPPDVRESEVHWSISGNAILAGFQQIPGIGDKTAAAIVRARDWEYEGQINDWDDLAMVYRVGPETIKKIKAFVSHSDPFGVYRLPNVLESVRNQLARGDLGRLPSPTHRAVEVPQSKGTDTLVTFLGQVKHRNLRDIFEVNNKRGTPLEESEVKYPHLKEWMILTCADETELLSVSFDRWKYPKFKEAIWNLEIDHDLILVRGVKKGWQSWRSIYVTEMWVISPDESDFIRDETEDMVL